MQEKKIIIRGARQHNLQNVNLDIPRNKIIAFTGVSGSGKSSLAFDTLYAEGQRRYVESLSAYARQFLGQMERPEVDFIEGLSPSISIEQKTVSRNPRSTVATMTEIYDYMRVLFARSGIPHCVQCGREVGAQTTDEIIDKILEIPAGKKIMILAPIAREQNKHIMEGLSRRYGFSLDAPWSDLTDKQRNVVLYGTGRRRIEFIYKSYSGRSHKYRKRYAGVIPIHEQKFRNTDSEGMRKHLAKFTADVPCHECKGGRLRQESMAVTIADKSIVDVVRLSIDDAADFFDTLPSQLTETQLLIGEELIKEIRGRLEFLRNVGLNYLTLDRTAPTLSGGEAQRIRLASQIGSGLVGVLYILDEPTIGLHSRDNRRLLSALKQLRDRGNTVIIIEHDEETMRSADLIVDFGPGPGVKGGHVVAVGTPYEIGCNENSITGKYLSGKLEIPIPDTRRSVNGKWLKIVGAEHNNLKNIDVEIPLGLFTCVTGVSGSGKTSLALDTIYAEGQRRYVESLSSYARQFLGQMPKPHVDFISGLAPAIAIEQKPASKSPRSTVGTVTEIYDYMRVLFARIGTPHCHKCGREISTQTAQQIVDSIMRYSDLWRAYIMAPVEIERSESYETIFKRAFNGGEVLKEIRSRLRFLVDVGLDYLTLGRSAPTLSGGEAQRVKLSKELARPSTGKTLYLLDEPTTGLHFADIQKLLDVLNRFVDKGNTVVVIEHNLDVIKNADYIIDLGPEGGDEGGMIVACGTPEELAQIEASHTGRFIRNVL